MGETSGHKEAFLTEVLGFLKAQNLEGLIFLFSVVLTDPSCDLQDPQEWKHRQYLLLSKDVQDCMHCQNLLFIPLVALYKVILLL